MAEPHPAKRPAAGAALLHPFFAGHRREQQMQASELRLPSHWTHVRGFNGTAQRVDVTDHMKEKIERFLLDCFLVEHACKGRDTVDKQTFTHFNVTRVERIENPHLWRQYAANRKAISEKLGYHAKPVENDVSRSSLQCTKHYPSASTLHTKECNEHVLFHGTRNQEIAQLISQTGIDGRFTTRAMLGLGGYFAENSSKADEYTVGTDTQERTMILSRVVLGDALYDTSVQPTRRIARNYSKKGEPVGKVFDSVIANTKRQDPKNPLSKHREFVIFERHQAYPEFIVTYQRLPLKPPPKASTTSSSA